MEYINTPIGLIHPSPTNPRKSFPAEEMAEMIDSVKRHGILQPILVREWPATYAFDGEWPPKYELIAGERRYRAAKGAELDSIPVMVRQLNDNEVLEIQIIENLQRKGLHEIEEAEGYELMIKDHGYTADELAEKIGKSRAYIYGRMKLTALCMGARLAFRDRKLTASTALLVARIPGEKMQMEAIDKITGTWEGVMSFRRASEIIQRDFCFLLEKAPFPQENLMLAPAAGACSTCPKRSGTSPELHPETNRTDVCTDPTCYRGKSQAWISYQAAEAKKEGKKVIVGKEAEKIDPEYSSTHEKLDSTNYSTKIPGKDGYSTNREILEFLGDKAPEVILVENQRKGALVEAVSNDQLKKALKEAGLTKADAIDPAQQKLEQKAKEETELRQALFKAMREGLKRDFEDRGPGLETDELRIIARHYWTALWHESKKAVARLWVEDAANDTARIEQVGELIKTTDSTIVLLRLMMDMAICGQLGVPAYHIDKPCADLELMATSVGIDIAAFRQAHQAAKSSKSKTAKSISTPPKAPLGAGSERELDETPKVGDRVRVKEGGKAAKRVMARKYCGREGDIEAQRGPFFAVRFAPGKNGVVADLTREEFDLLPAPIAFSTASEPAPTPSKAARARVMYRHPKHETLEWSGRGKQPMWVANWINDGGELEALRLQGEEQKQSSASGEANAKPSVAESVPRCTKTLELPLA